MDPAQLAEQLASASPDALREMVASLANAMMPAQADQVCRARYGERSAASCRDFSKRVGEARKAVMGRRAEHLAPTAHR